MDFTVFQYITEIPELINDRVWYELAVRSYNLGLMCFWFLIATYLLDKLFICFSKLYTRGKD